MPKSLLYLSCVRFNFCRVSEGLLAQNFVRRTAPRDAAVAGSFAKALAFFWTCRLTIKPIASNVALGMKQKKPGSEMS